MVEMVDDKGHKKEVCLALSGVDIQNSVGCRWLRQMVQLVIPEGVGELCEVFCMVQESFPCYIS